MAINSITISQDNKVNGSDLLPVHSTLVFLADVNYTGEYPLSILVDIIEDGDILETFRASVNTDLLANLRQFYFVANDVIKGLMGSFDDFAQLNDTLAYVNDITKTVTLKFRDPDNELTFDETTVTFVHGAAQFGENPNLDTIYNNEPSLYYGVEGGFVYVYFYNENESNALTIDSPISSLELAQDFDDAVFTDGNLVDFEIYTAV
jgi:hypothetical protein